MRGKICAIYAAYAPVRTRLNLAFDLVFRPMTNSHDPYNPHFTYPVNQDNRRTKDELTSRKLKKKSISSLNLVFKGDISVHKHTLKFSIKSFHNTNPINRIIYNP